MPRLRATTGFTLLELLLVVAIMGIMAALLIPSSASDVHSELTAAARFVAADLAYARSLAVTNGGNYRVAFEVRANRYTLTYAGSNPALVALPVTSSRRLARADQYVADLDEAPGLVGGARLYAVGTAGNSPTPLTEIEFDKNGATTRSEDTALWLIAGPSDARSFIAVRISAVTGLVATDEVDGVGPNETIIPADVRSDPDFADLHGGNAVVTPVEKGG